MHAWNRRSLLKVAGAVSAQTLIGASNSLLAEAQTSRRIGPNDQIQIALIGAGGQGQSDTRYAVQVPGVKLVAVADCYDGRLARSKEVWGNDLMTTRDYREILARPDIDAVIMRAVVGGAESADDPAVHRPEEAAARAGGRGWW